MKKIINELKAINIFNPMDWYRLFYRHRLIHFLFTGGTGVLINLAVTAFFAEIIYGRENYFVAYLLGLGSNLIYNFTLHTIMTFKTKSNHKKRFSLFAIYSIVMAVFQAMLTKEIVSLVGVDYYLIVIASIILIFSVVTYFFFKLWLFNENGTKK